MNTIKKWYPNAPNYVNYKRSNWGSDPFSLGSYPFVKAGGTPDCCKAYQESDSTNDKIFFAGDGTTCQMIGTVHGAYLTGVKAAQNAAGIQDSSSLVGLFVKTTSLIAIIAMMFAF